LPIATEPRILILSGAVPQTWYAGSLLLYRLLQHHPSALLKAVGPRPQPSSDTLACEYAELLPAPSSRLDLTRLAEFKRSLQAMSLVGRIPDSRVDQAVGRFQPDVVVTVMERFDYVDAAHRFCRRHGLPLAVMVHDRLESFERVYPAFAPAQQRRFADVYQDAAVRFCISPEMEQCLQMAYGAAGTVLYPNRAEELTPRPVEASSLLAAPPGLTIGYAGAMNYGYGERIAQVMPRLAAAGITLRVYSREAPPEMKGVVYAGAFRRTIDLWEQVKKECDVVWLPYSYSAELRSLYETHFPSKLTEYLALGMPVLITGPSYATGVRWGLRHPDAAAVVTDEQPEQILDALERLRESAPWRLQLASEARSAGDADFEPARIRAIFLEALATASRSVPVAS
jgi:glycosyltransferase involved in cell wall biosynthesis